MYVHKILVNEGFGGFNLISFERYFLWLRCQRFCKIESRFMQTAGRERERERENMKYIYVPVYIHTYLCMYVGWWHHNLKKNPMPPGGPNKGMYIHTSYIAQLTRRGPVIAGCRGSRSKPAIFYEA